jgi:hypothetical protein
LASTLAASSPAMLPPRTTAVDLSASIVISRIFGRKSAVSVKALFSHCRRNHTSFSYARKCYVRLGSANNCLFV